MKKADAAFGGYRAFYSRPPLFMVVTAPSPEALRAKIEKLDAQMADVPDQTGCSA